MIIALLLPLAMLSAEPAPDAGKLLSASAEKIRSLEGFTLVVRQRIFNPGRSMRSTEFRVDRAPGGRIRVELDKGKQLFVSNGERWWRYYSVKRIYYEDTDPEGGLAGGLNENLRRTMERFEMLRKNAAEARFMRWDRLPFAGNKVSCAVLELRSPHRGDEWIARLWIDPQSLLVLRADMERISGITEAGENTGQTHNLETAGTLTRSTQESHYDWRSLEPPADDSIFQFVPPAGAKRVERLPE